MGPGFPYMREFRRRRQCRIGLTAYRGLRELVTYISPLDLVRHRAPERPVACARPARVALAAHWFQERFPGNVFYAVKANPSPWALDALYEGGVQGFDVASEAEVELVATRFPDARLIFMNPVKSRRAIQRAYFEFGVRAFSLDCVEELDKIVAVTGGARDLQLIVRLAVDNGGAALPLAGKFGATAFDAPELLRRARAHADELGVSFHVGSQCMTPASYRGAMRDASRLITRAGVTVDIVNVGGGFPSLYPGMTPPPLEAYIDEIKDAFEEMPVLENADLWCEPGRALVAEGQSLLTRVELRKGDALYLNDGAFGMLFDAAHMNWRFPMRVIRAEGEFSAEERPFRLFGPTCDSMDAMPGPFDLPADIGEGDYLEIGMLGAYGVSMGTRFNGFGDTETEVVGDFPWSSLYASEPRTVPTEQGAVVAFPAKRKRARARRR